MKHIPVGRAASLRTGESGFLCNCGQTIIGKADCKEHFDGPPKDELLSDKELAGLVEWSKRELEDKQ